MRACASLVLFAVACSDQLFPCALDGDCQNGGNGGVCQPEGVCSFPDDGCPSGQRFGAHSGGLSNECVPPPQSDGTSLASSSSSMGTSAGEVDPTLDVSGNDSLSASTTDTTPTGDTAGESTTSASDTTGEPLDPDLLLWFTFEHDSEVALVNDGILGGEALCPMSSCPLSIAEGAIGAAATFDGENDCGVFPFVEDLNAPELTLALWVRRDVPVSGYDGAFTKPVGQGAYNTWRVSVQGSAESEIVSVHVGLQDNMGVELTSVLQLGVWTHMVSTWSGSELELWIDGVSMGALPSDLFEVDDHDVYVGCDDDVPVGITHFLHGSLDDVRMYSRVLDGAEIAELAARR